MMLTSYLDFHSGCRSLRGLDNELAFTQEVLVAVGPRKATRVAPAVKAEALHR